MTIMFCYEYYDYHEFDDYHDYCFSKHAIVFIISSSLVKTLIVLSL